MTHYYLDTSALSKRYVQEAGTEWVRDLAAPDAGNLLLTARITMVEFYSALARRRREGAVPTNAIRVAARAFTKHSASEYDFVELTMEVVQVARELLERHPLRAYDAVQLASALVANQVLSANGLSSLIFVSADARLNRAADAESFLIDDPNEH